MSARENTVDVEQYVDLSRLIVSPEAVMCLSESNARRLQIVPVALINEQGKDCLVVAASSTSDSAQQDRIRRLSNQQHEIRMVAAEDKQILAAVDKCYRHEHEFNAILDQCAHTNGSLAVAGGADDFSVHLLEALLREAYRRRASDVHLSPGSEELLIRFRIDGVLQHVCKLQLRFFSSLVVRIKVLAGLDIAETRLPQDGQFDQLVDGQRLEFRVSMFPTIAGENAVLRVIDARCFLTLDALNLTQDSLDTLRHLVSRPDGMIIVSGPTGSGKSTSLFALLAEKDTQALNILTLEDPVEHRLSGIQQSSVDPHRSFDYPEGVKAMLRQDPDVLLIGEIRDPQSCEMALRAATTGHQVLTTIHAASAHAALLRLRELNAQNHILSNCLSAIIAQRLARKDCTVCDSDGTYCLQCNGTGFFGRQIILEILVISESIRQMISENVDVAEIETHSRASGFVDMRSCAQLSIDSGIVSENEIHRVLGGDDLVH